MKISTKGAARLWHDGQIALAEVEHNGVRVDMDYLHKTIKDTDAEIKDIQKQMRSDKVYNEWRKVYGGKLNLNSRLQLHKVVFEKMGFKEREHATKKKYKAATGDYVKKESKYDEAAFAHVDLPFIKTYFQCEKLKKLKGTYFEGILHEVVDGRIHPSYNLHTVITYRSSCNGNNFQNIPSRNQRIAEMIRRCYIPKKGWQLAEIDYGTIEVRASCFYNKDPKLIKYMEDDKLDMHRDMAMKIFMLPPELVEKKTTRDWSKNRFVFPEFYGSVFFQCAPDLWKGVMSGAMLPNGMSIRDHLRSKGVKSLGDCEQPRDTKPGTFVHQVKKAEDYLWNETFTVYTEWKKRWHHDYLRTGGFFLKTGFYVHGLFSRNQVINIPVQGVAFHCTLQAMIWIMKEFKRRKMRSRVIGEIHDCILYEVAPGEMQDVLAISEEIMTLWVPREWSWINVPLKVECEVCETDAPWNTKKVWTLQEGTYKPKAA